MRPVRLPHSQRFLVLRKKWEQPIYHLPQEFHVSKRAWTGSFPGQASAVLELKAQRRDAKGMEVALPFRVDRRAWSGDTWRVEAAGTRSSMPVLATSC